MNLDTSFHITEGGVAVLLMDNQHSSLNIIGPSFLKSLDKAITEISTIPHVKAMVICSAKKKRIYRRS